jgi:hypothetical protein
MALMQTYCFGNDLSLVFRSMSVRLAFLSGQKFARLVNLQG